MLKTRAGILKNFQKNIKDLYALAKAEELKKTTAEAKMAVEQTKMNEAAKEAEACLAVAKKLEDLISA